MGKVLQSGDWELTAEEMEQLLVTQPRAISIDVNIYMSKFLQKFHCSHVNIRWQQIPVN